MANIQNMHNCEHCPYTTKKRANLVRHLQRKNSCRPFDAETTEQAENANTSTLTINQQPNKFSKECPKCNKVLISNFGYKYHVSKCNGLSPLQCETCLKTFSSASGKYQHRKNVKCIAVEPLPPPPPPSPESASLASSSSSSSSTSVNGDHNTINMNNSNNTNVTNVTNIISFGDDGIDQIREYLSDKSSIINDFRQIARKKFTGIRDVQSKLFFDLDNPQGMTIIKPERYGSGVHVRNEKGRFEYMEFRDVRETIFEYIEVYVEEYNNNRNRLNVRYTDPREREMVKKYLEILDEELDVQIPGDLMNDLSITPTPSNDPDNTETEAEKNVRYKTFDKMSLKNLHEQTRKYYQKKNGVYKVKERSLIEE